MTDTLGERRSDGQPPDRRSPSPPTGRTVEIVTVIADDGPLTLADIVRRTRHSRATAHAVVSELAARGWVNRTGDGHFTVGPALRDLAVSIAHADPVSRFARPVLEDLAAELVGTKYLVIKATGL